jgi:hypothetical protein
VVTLDTIVMKPVGVAGTTQAEITALAAEPPPTSFDDLLDAHQAYFGSVNIFRKIYTSMVLPKAQQVQTSVSALDLDTALEWAALWQRAVAKQQLTASFTSEIETLTQVLASAVQRHTAAAAERCYSQKRPEEGFQLLRYLRYARTYLGGTAMSNIEVKLRGCLTFRVQLRTWITERTDDWGWKHMLHTEPVVLRWQDEMRATGRGALDYDAVEWIGKPVDLCVMSGSGAGSTLDAASATYRLTLAPVSRSSAAVTVTFSYDPGTPVETKTIWCPEAPGGTGQRTHWREYYNQMHAYERHGAGFRAQATIVGVGSFTGWVYNHTGTGSEGSLQEETFIDIEHTPQP